MSSCALFALPYNADVTTHGTPSCDQVVVMQHAHCTQPRVVGPAARGRAESRNAVRSYTDSISDWTPLSATPVRIR